MTNVKVVELNTKNMRTKQLAEKWAKEYLNTEEGKKETEKLNRETIDYIIFGKPTRYLNEELLDEMDSFIKTEELSIEEMELKQIVQKLVGSISPSGESHLDTKRLENLKVMCGLIEDLVYEVNYVARDKDRYESSMKENGSLCSKVFR